MISIRRVGLQKIFRKLVTTLVMKIYQMTMNLSITYSVLLPVMVCRSQVRVKKIWSAYAFCAFYKLLNQSLIRPCFETLKDMRGLQHIGVAIHPTLNLINHSCNPNCIAISCGPGTC